MNVSEAVAARTTIRRFTDQKVEDALVKKLLEKSARAPSGGNLQPWRIFVITSDTMPVFLKHVDQSEFQSEPEYNIYPADLKSPYRDSRFKVGEDMYGLLGIPRDDKAGRLGNLAKNFEFFGAPTGFFCFVDRCMGPPQWSDLGMFLQTFMLLAQEAGLSTCPQEAWAARSNSVKSFINPDDNLMLFCGMAIGYKDNNEAVNNLYSDHEPLNVWATFL